MIRNRPKPKKYIPSVKSSQNDGISKIYFISNDTHNPRFGRPAVHVITLIDCLLHSGRKQQSHEMCIYMIKYCMECFVYFSTIYGGNKHRAVLDKPTPVQTLLPPILLLY